MTVISNSNEQSNAYWLARQKDEIASLRAENEILKGELKVKCGDCNRNDTFEENVRLKAEVEALKAEMEELVGGAEERANNLACENADLKQELQKRRDSEPQRLLEWRGINVEYGGAKVCRDCSGSGVKAYPSTSTWRGGIGGQAITTDICDKCWGSGDLNRPWLDLRALKPYRWNHD